MSLFEERRGLYAIVDPAHTGARSPLELAEAIVAGGPALFQYRDKTQSDRDRLRLGRELRTLCRRAGIPFIVNDRLDLALLLGADGAHLGQEDLPIEAARRIAPSLPLGRSTHSVEQARAAAREDHAILGFGPVFPTKTKERPDPVTGLDVLARLRSELPLPLVAIGGINLDTVGEIARTGAHYAAVISALADADDPEAMTRALHLRFIEALSANAQG